MEQRVAHKKLPDDRLRACIRSAGLARLWRDLQWHKPGKGESWNSQRQNRHKNGTARPTERGRGTELAGEWQGCSGAWKYNYKTKEKYVCGQRLERHK
jgi:hypothetical protein